MDGARFTYVSEGLSPGCDWCAGQADRATGPGARLPRAGSGARTETAEDA